MIEFVDLNAYVNIAIVIVCLAIGKILKSSDATKSLDNKYIPYILLIVAVVIQFWISGVNPTSLITGIVSAATAIGFHQGGKILIKKES